MTVYIVNEYEYDGCDDEYCVTHAFNDKIKAEQFLSKFMYDGDIRMKVEEITTDDILVNSFYPNIYFSVWFSRHKIYAKSIGKSNVPESVIKVSIDGMYTLVSGTLKPISNDETKYLFDKRVCEVATKKFNEYMEGKVK